MIKVYPSKLSGDAVEEHKIREACTLVDWVQRLAGVPVDLTQPQPVSISVDGEHIPVQQWASFNVLPDDDVAVVYEAKGGVVDSIGGVISSVINSVLKVFIRNPSTGGNFGDGNSKRQQDELDLATIKANQPKLNDPIPERFGLSLVYPDYIVPNRTYFEVTKEQEESEQYTDMFLSLGYGEYSVSRGQVYVGQTPLVSLGDGASFDVYPPGADISKDRRADYWVTAEEVGGTSIGKAGLELGATFSVDPNPNAAAYTFSGVAVSIPRSAGEFPKWSAGQYVRIKRYTPVEFVMYEGVSAFVGNINNADFQAGDEIRIRTSGVDRNARVLDVIDRQDADSLYTIADTDGVPVDWIDPGTYDTSINYRGSLYLITGIEEGDSPSFITVAMLDDSNEELLNWRGFDTRRTSRASLTLNGNDISGGWTGPFTACNENETASEIEIDFMFPNGLTEYDSGDPDKNYRRSVAFEVQWRDANGLGEWQSWEHRINGNTGDQYAETHRIKLNGSMRPQVRVRRKGAADESTLVMDEAQWYALKARIDNPPRRYSEVSTLAVRLRTGSRIAAQTDNKINVYTTRVLPPFDDPERPARPTRAIADAVMYVARGLGYSSVQVDTQELSRLHRTWQNRGDTFDHSYLETTGAKKALNDMLGAGFAEVVVDRGKLLPVRDEPRETFEAMYTPANTRSALTIEFTLKNMNSTDDFDGVDVEYRSIRTGEKETVECRLPGDAGRKVRKVSVAGINDRTRAWRYGMRIRRQMKYRRQQYSFDTGFDALNSGYLSYVQLVDDYQTFGQHSQVASVRRVGDGLLVLDLDEPLDLTEARGVFLRRPDGSPAGPYTVQEHTADGGIVVQEPDFAVVGMLGDTDPTVVVPDIRHRAFYPCLIQSVVPKGRPNGDSEPTVTVTAVNYAPEVYADDDNTPD